MRVAGNLTPEVCLSLDAKAETELACSRSYRARLEFFFNFFLAQGVRLP